MPLESNSPHPSVWTASSSAGSSTEEGLGLLVGPRLTCVGSSLLSWPCHLHCATHCQHQEKFIMGDFESGAGFLTIFKMMLDFDDFGTYAGLFTILKIMLDFFGFGTAGF